MTTEIKSMGNELAGVVQNLNDAENLVKKLSKDIDRFGNVMADSFAAPLAAVETLGEQLKKFDPSELTERIKTAARDWTSSLAAAAEGIGNIMSAIGRAEQAKLDASFKLRREYIEATVADEEERAAQLAALEEEQEAKNLELQKEHAARQKALGLFSVVVDTAAAVMRSLKELGPIAGAISAGAVTALGVAQGAIIASQPEPFAAGALIQGGRGGVLGQVGEGRESELILPLETGVEKLAAKLDSRQQASNTVNINVGTLVADDKGIRELERRMRQFRIAEDKRTGVNV